jgi:hypothetical protein
MTITLYNYNELERVELEVIPVPMLLQIAKREIGDTIVTTMLLGQSSMVKEDRFQT